MTWQEINRKRLPYIRMGDRMFTGMYGDIRKKLIVQIKEAGQPEDMIEIARDINIDKGNVINVMEKFYSKTSIDWAKMTAKSLKRLERKNEEDWVAGIMEFLRTKRKDVIDKIVKNHGADIENIVRKAVETGIEEGWGMEKIARQISKSQGQMDLWKGMRIARTEVVTASNEGVKMGADELVGNKQKVWISTFDSSSREDHMAMDGRVVPYNELFELPTGDRLEYPGDASNGADPGQTINCRCGWEIIVTPERY